MKNIALKTILIVNFCVISVAIAESSKTEKSTKNIVRLNLPKENRWDFQSAFAAMPPIPAKASVQFSTQKNMIKQGSTQIDLNRFRAKIVNQKTLTKPDAVSQIPSVPKFENSPEFNFPELQVHQQNLIEIKPEEYKMLQALLLIEGANYETAMPLLVDMMNLPEYQEQATLLYAKVTLELGLFTEYRETMLKYFHESKNSAHRKLVIESLVQNVKVLTSTDVAMIDPVVQILEINTTASPLYLFKKAQYLYEKNNKKEFDQIVEQISAQTQEYNEAQLLKALFEYKDKNLNEAAVTLESLWTRINEDSKNEVRNMTALTLARLYFQNSDYASSLKYYQYIHESSKEYLESSIEKSWAQILNRNNQSAVEFMYEFYEDYLVQNYAPEGYIARAAGYLNLCQYNEGVQVLEDMNKRYKNVLGLLKMYQQSHADSASYYDLAQGFQKNDKEDLEGLPNYFLKRFVSDARFQVLQKRIKKFEEENSNLNKLTIKLIRKERETKMAMLKAKNSLAAARREEADNEVISKLEQAYTDAGVDNYIYARARAGMKKIRDSAIVRLSDLQKQSRVKTADHLKEFYTEMISDLQNSIQQQEELTYKMYSKNSSSQNSGEYVMTFKKEVWNGSASYSRTALKDACVESQRSISSVEESVNQEGDK